MKLSLKNVRLSFPDLFEATDFQGNGDFKFGATFLIQKDDPQIAQINAAIDEVGLEKWGKEWAGMKPGMIKKEYIALKDGDERPEYNGYPGCYYIKASNKARPTVVDRDRSPLVAADGRPYSGCYVNANIALYAQDNKYGKKINATLMGVQFFRDGDAFTGGGVSTADDFDDVTAGADAEDLV